MKNLFLTITVIFALLNVVTGQERTVFNGKTQLNTGTTYISYTGIAADTLTETNQDTIDFVFTNTNHYAIEKVSFSIIADTLAGNDSVYYTLTGLNYYPAGNETNIVSGGLLFNASNDIGEVLKVWNDSTNYDISFRYYKFRLIQSANNSYDGGIEINKIIAKLYYK